MPIQAELSFDKFGAANPNAKFEKAFIRIANNTDNTSNYCPVTKEKLKAATEDLKGIINWTTADDGPEYTAIRAKFLENYKILNNVALLMPCYHEDWRITFGDITDEDKPWDEVTREQPTKKGYYLKDTHDKLFVDVVNLSMDHSGNHPVIAYPVPRPEDLADYRKRWIDIYNGRLNNKDKKKALKAIKYETFTYSSMNAVSMRIVCNMYRTWLADHTEITHVLLPDVSMAKHIFPTTSTGRSFNASCFEKYEDYEYGRKITFMFTLTPKQLTEYEESGYTLQSDILEVLSMKPGSIHCKVNVIRSVAQIRSVLNNLASATNPDGSRKYRNLSVDTETTGLNPVWFDQHILAGGFSNGEEAWVFLVDHPYYAEHKNLELMSTLMEYNFDLIFQNGKFDIKWIKHFTGKLPGGMIYDTMLLDHWLYENYGSLTSDLNLSPGLYSMALQTSRYLGLTTHKTMLDKYFAKIEVENPQPKPKKGDDLANLTIKELREIIATRTADVREPNSWAYAKLPLRILLRYLGYDCYATYKIFEQQMKRITDETNGRMPRVITELMPKELILVADMELTGANISYDKIIEQIKKANTVIEENKAVVKDALRYEFNIDSGEQLSAYLMREYKIPAADFMTDETDPGKICTDTDTLAKFVDKAPWLKNYIAYKKAAKARNTYLIPFIYYSYKGRLYFNLKMTGTVTGRLASDKPNMQNIPKTLGDGPNRIEVKQVICATEGKILMDSDLANAEAKVLSAVCPDPKLIEAIRNDMDLHCYTASHAYGVPYEKLYEAHMIKEGKEGYENIKPTAEHKLHQKLRKAAKSTTFLVLYGGGAAGLAKQLPSTYTDKKELSVEDNAKKKKWHDIKAAEDLIKKLKESIYTILGETFKKSDKTILQKGYGESIFGRRRRYYLTLPHVIYKIIRDAGLSNPLGPERIKKLVSNQRPFRQNVNFQIQSSTSDYMQYFVSYIKEHLPEDIQAELWFTVHDSLVGEFIDTPENRQRVIDIFDEAMYRYLPSLSSKLVVNIGHNIGFTKEYCQLSD